VTFGWLSRLSLAASVGLVTTVVYIDGFVSPMIENAHDDEGSMALFRQALFRHRWWDGEGVR
jgi:hypothetical protein